MRRAVATMIFGVAVGVQAVGAVLVLLGALLIGGAEGLATTVIGRIEQGGREDE